MSYGRTLAVLGAVGIGIYLMRRANSFAIALPVNGLGVDPIVTYSDEDGHPISKENYDQRMAINAQLDAADKDIAAINSYPITFPPMPAFGPVPWQQTVRARA